MDQTHTQSDSLTKRNVAVLVAAQAVLGAQLPMIFTIAGLAGQSLAPNACWATLPISAMVIGSMLTATPISAFMQKHGRRAGFVVGAMGGAMQMKRKVRCARPAAAAAPRVLPPPSLAAAPAPFRNFLRLTPFCLVLMSSPPV